MKLEKTLYGLHEVGKESYFELDHIFIELGVQKDKNWIYVYKSEVTIFVYMDDLASVVKREDRLGEAIKLIKSKFEIKNLKNF